MNNAWLILWTVLIAASIAWYAFLLFYVGAKAGREIIAMVKCLGERNQK